MQHRTKYLVSLYVFYLVYFATNCFGNYYGLYLGEQRMTDGQIGLILNGTVLLGMLLQPLWGMMADRSRRKRNVLALFCALAGVVSMLMDSVSGFMPFLLLILAINTLLLPASPVLSSLSMEYAAENGHRFGPLRMMGTIGYMLGAAMLGWVMTDTYRGMFRISGALLLACAGLALLLPPVAGRQRAEKRLSPFLILRDRRICLMLLFTTLCAITNTFYCTFFTKYLGADLQLDPGTVSLIIVLSTVLEVPFLFIADRLMKKLSVWIWILIGLGLNGLRWLWLGQATTLPMILVCQIPSVLAMACSEYFPMVYINSRAAPELKSSAQTMVSLLSGGTSRVVGGLLGGLLADQWRIAGGFIVCGALLLVAFAAALVPCIRMARVERAEQREALPQSGTN